MRNCGRAFALSRLVPRRALHRYRRGRIRRFLTKLPMWLIYIVAAAISLCLLVGGILLILWNLRIVTKRDVLFRWRRAQFNLAMLLALVTAVAVDFAVLHYLRADVSRPEALILALGATGLLLILVGVVWVLVVDLKSERKNKGVYKQVQESSPPRSSGKAERPRLPRIEPSAPSGLGALGSWLLRRRK